MIDLDGHFSILYRTILHLSINSNDRQIFFGIPDTKPSKPLAINYIHNLSKLHCLFGVLRLQVGLVVTVLAHRREGSAPR